MSLFSADESLREPFNTLVDRLLADVELKPADIFLHALESEADTQMNYWVVRLLIEREEVDPHHAVSQDSAGAAVMPLHAACLLKNMGALAAMLDLDAYQGSPLGSEFGSALRICQTQGFDHGAGLMMAHAKQHDLLEALLLSLQGVKPH
ncbi:hypothetical protein [Thiomicrospira sp. ALE5]|uniref:hypothetical protein n=1 Tax=Thiomicrospira sp. ALE5 TaxID=748650 RepID=UPI0008F2CBFB|nr:hypothetical protein [Thiomicrospira sp. ALE5]SFR64086.1 hypothetical protein SAMN03092900_1986 [Thiomicrospira sp. ALE5]